METAPGLAIGAPTLLETGIVLAAKPGVDRSLLPRLLEKCRVREIPFDHRHRLVAERAFARYGRGNHPAELNYGDCMTYATARIGGAPLLFVGDDFAKTDLPPAI
jgi:ribonuclease VapC